MTTETPTATAVRLQATVDVPQEHAFALWFDEVGGHHGQRWTNRDRRWARAVAQPVATAPLESSRHPRSAEIARVTS